MLEKVGSPLPTFVVALGTNIELENEGETSLRKPEIQLIHI
jgi:hypothetical protein